MVKRIALVALVAVVSLISAGCAGVNPFDNPQGYSGINEVEANFQVPEGERGPTWIRVVGGKEETDVAFSFVLPDGTEFSYSATGVKAFEGAALRAAVEKAISSDVKESIPGIVDGVVSSILGVRP